MPDTREIGPQYTRAAIQPKSLDVSARTVDVVFATETPVLRRDYYGEFFMEILGCKPEEADLTRMNARAPLLDSHLRGKLSTQIGVVENARIENNQCIATIRFSKRADVEPIWQDVQDGIYANISVGYDVGKYQVVETGETSIPVLRAIQWIGGELSLLSVPADINSGIRSEEPTKKVTIINLKSRNMPGDNPADTIPGATKPQPAQSGETAQEARVAVTIAERHRSGEITKMCNTHKLPSDFTTDLISGDKSLDQAREAILIKLSEKQPDISGIGATTRVGADSIDKMRTGMEFGLLARVEPSAENRTKAGEYYGLGLIEMARECLQANGVNPRGMSKREVSMQALGLTRSGGMMSSSDFPNILAGVFNKRLRKAYALQERTFLPWAYASTATDFRDMLRVQLGDLQFDTILEGGEYKAGSIGEASEKYKVAKYGKKVLITWETIINDDLSAFDRIPTIMSAASAQKQSDIMYGILTANGNMADGKALFSSDHANLAGAGSAITIAALSAGRAAMRKQKSLGGNVLNITPKYLVVGPDKEAEALQLTSANYVSTKQSDVNVWVGTLTPIVDARLTGNQWYLIANPSVIDTVEYSFLDGEELFIDDRMAFDQDGYEIKARTVFGAKAIDWKGLYKNPGA